MDICNYLEDKAKLLMRMPKVSFIGIGISNSALISSLIGSKYEITVRDKNPKRLDNMPKGFKPTRIYTGSEWLSELYDDVIFISPSVRRDIPEIAAAEAHGAILSSDLDLYLVDNTPKIAISGSDGKSTTATLVSMLTGYKLCGNIGLPFKFGGEAVELSSFQLQFSSVRSECSLITSISENHLDWHTSYEEYIKAKLSLLENSEFPAISYDDEPSRRYLKERSVGAVFSVSTDLTTLKKEVKAEHYITKTREYIEVDGSPFLKIGEVKRGEWYNIKNLMGAMAVSQGLYDIDTLRLVAKDFRGLPDRCELVGRLGDNDLINSSIDTTPTRTATTLSALARPVSIILGGRGKGLSLSPLLPYLKAYATHISIYGEVGSEFHTALTKEGLRAELFSDFDSAVYSAIEGASPGDAILLSPAATSYGEFQSYRERGARFTEIVNRLKNENTAG